MTYLHPELFTGHPEPPLALLVVGNRLQQMPLAEILFVLSQGAGFRHGRCQYGLEDT